MKKLLPSALLLSMVAVPAFAAEEQVGSGETNGYTLVWQELFDDAELNPMRWNVEVNGSGGGNNELQYYREENVSVGDDGQGNGCLILTARRESYRGKSFTSGRINSKARIAFTHGKIEASIKFPSTANGLWPAFWMMGNDYDEVGWPKCGETDIVEMGNANGISAGTQDRYYNGATHWGPSWPASDYAKSQTKAYSLQDGEFHLYTLIWDDTTMKMYIDLDQRPVQNPYFSFSCPQDDPTNEWSAGNYFHKDNFIIFNLAVGGTFTGITSASDVTALNDDNDNEAKMYVNYVRIYQKGLDSDHTDFVDPGDQAGVQQVFETAKESLNFDGTTLYSPTPAIDLYSVSGSLVATTANGSLTVSGIAPGIYIAKSKSATKKIVIR
jgi:beta-glucanase (GH16 family)